MKNHVISQLSDSANDFKNVVWPSVSEIPLVGGGKIQPVEAVAEKNFKDELDLLAGIDAWQIQYEPSAIRGIASRVQWGASYGSFSIRTRSASGNETEFQKRLRAIQSIDEGHLYPHLTIQAYLDKPRGCLQSVAVIKTIDLINRAAILVENRDKDKLQHRPDLYGFIDNPDGTEFLYMKWEYLKYVKLLDEQNIVQIQT